MLTRPDKISDRQNSKDVAIVSAEDKIVIAPIVSPLSLTTSLSFNASARYPCTLRLTQWGTIYPAEQQGGR
jgi:hypothetical protein